MTLNEFSDAFDVKIASYILENNFGESNKLSFDEYEKSVFLSQAQEDIILELYSGRNDKGLSFESSEESRRLLQSLLGEVKYSLWEDETINKPEDLWFIVYEECSSNDTRIPVIPVKQDFLHEILENPFKRPSDKRILRVDGPEIKLLWDNKPINLIYKILYLKRPYPIILSEFDGLLVNGKSESKECEVDSSLHSSIVDRAIALALKSRALLLNNKQ